MLEAPAAQVDAEAPRPPGRQGNKGMWLHHGLHFLTSAAPGLIIFTAVMLVPMAMVIGTSLTDRNNYIPETNFVGLENYFYLFQDGAFLQALRNTLILTAIVTIFPNALGLGIAVLLDRRNIVFNAFRAVFFIPIVLSGVVVSVIWGSILTDDGLLNTMLRNVGVADPPGWLSNPDLALYSIGFIMSWQAMGFCVVLYLAGLQGVPKELYEAATIDGAGPALRFRYVTWPMLAPAVTVTTTISLISGFKAYDQIQVITNGGPGIGTTNTLAFDIVREAVNGVHVGYAATMATVMLAIVALVSVTATALLRRREVEL